MTLCKNFNFCLVSSPGLACLIKRKRKLQLNWEIFVNIWGLPKLVGFMPKPPGVVTVPAVDFLSTSFVSVVGEQQMSSQTWANIVVLFGPEQVGKGLSKDAKAQKLAFQHWIEAVSYISGVSLWPAFQILLSLLLLLLSVNFRLIQGIVMGITCICIMKNGVKQMLVSHSSIGKRNLLLVYQVFF